MNETAMIYIVDDDQAIRDSLLTLFEVHELSAVAYTGAREFLQLYHAAMRGCVLIDVRMPEMDGYRLHEELCKRETKLAMILMSGHLDRDKPTQYIEAQGTPVLEKPFSTDRLLAMVRERLIAAA